MKLTALILAALLPIAAYASCRSYTYTGPNGRMVFCTECCYGGHCTITCN